MIMCSVVPRSLTIEQSVLTWTRVGATEALWASVIKSALGNIRSGLDTPTHGPDGAQIGAAPYDRGLPEFDSRGRP
jgi:hypothetical protein